MTEDDVVPRLRELCLSLPEVVEGTNHHGEPSWRIRRRTLVQISERHPSGRRSFWVPAPAGAKEAMIATEPERFFSPPYGGRNWVGVYVDVPVDWTEVRELVVDAYRLIAPRTLVAELGDA
ncbi:MmcQ/YjbR family DNA-binding protein [Streptomyces sp. HNM0575]|uniref:MmcQ/YjbR family DNA-binding protein n=1 Tax=Streptomyces sp. HNM0575 TaxID=2716338 RepID=UPI00145D4C72|nr:MmcQ/YjbR family DNA-binding protein [Streptomyces sp. HNM0575]NLU73933.1 MmcQ/YjbR family DNA-binding protein [Streptomyces sp. HNM0575]